MIWIVVVLVALAAVVALVVVLGFLQPIHHEATRIISLPLHPEKTWGLVSELERWPDWNPYVKKVERMAEREGRPVFKITDGNGTIPSEILERVERQRLVTRISDPDLPFGGSWTWQVEPEGSGSRVTITERGEVRNLIFRFASRFLIGHTRSMDVYLRALARHTGAEGQPQSPGANPVPPPL